MINKLKEIVERNCISKEGNSSTLTYWSDVVFAKCVFLLAPLSMLAILPAIVICVQTQTYLILWFDVFCFCMLILVGYAPGISVRIRKILLISLLFLTAFVLLKELGNFGPGLVYLLSATVISLLLFPGKKTSLPFTLTLLFSAFYGLLIHYHFVEIQAKHKNHLMEWIAVSSNVLFMSALFSLIIPYFFSKLEGILEEKNQLIESVRKVNIELEKSIEEVTYKNFELEQFAFIASHDLQEPLRMIASFMDKLKLKYQNQLDDKAHQYIHFAVDGAIRMKKIILGLLEYSGAGKFAEATENVDLNDLVENYKILRRKIIQEKSVVLIANDLPAIEFHKAPLAQTIHCLLDNAIHYSKDGQHPIITISVNSRGNFWEIKIADNGIGIDPMFHEKIFIIFQRLHNQEKYEGTGIGLSIVKKHVELWGGKIWLESAPNEGAAIYFTIPKTQITKQLVV